MNFTLQDLIASFFALLIFPLVLLFPGYVIGWTFDVFDFRARLQLTRYAIASLMSVAMMPILVYLVSWSASTGVTRLIIAIFFLLYLLVTHMERKRNIAGQRFQNRMSRYQKIFVCVALAWILFTFLSLVDFQWGKFLYSTVVAYDFATRVTIVNAITRTGVPPVNPSFFPGHVEYITSLYYYWYILCSLVDQIGGKLVDARAALIAGDVWCGLTLMGLVGLYLKFRNNLGGDKAWKAALVGIGLLAVSGLDILPASTSMLSFRYLHGFMWPAGHLEDWNEQIASWVDSTFWVPHHVASLIACFTALLLFQYGRGKSILKNIAVAILAGLAFASAVGLSTWIMITFAIFLVVWVGVLLLQGGNRNLIMVLMLSGLVALICSSPFLLGVLKGGTGAVGAPVAFEVRRFSPLVGYVEMLSPLAQNIIFSVFLPLNYFLELGVFLVVGWLWLKYQQSKSTSRNSFQLLEITLLCVVVLVCSLMRSAIAANDLGWRGWLLGQFVLLIWTLDLWSLFPFLPFQDDFVNADLTRYGGRLKKLAGVLMVVGLSTTVLSVAILRFWPMLVDTGIVGFPNGYSVDTQLGPRSYSARLAYEFINENLPLNVVLQQNPSRKIDRPSGLYARNQFAISGNAPFNVPVSLVKLNSDNISKIFMTENVRSWDQIDRQCSTYFIDVLIINDLDALWKDLEKLQAQRPLLYKNDYYAVAACGKFASNAQP